MMKLLTLPSLALIAVLVPIQRALAADTMAVTLNPTNKSNASGTATTVALVEMSKLTAAPHTINVHRSAADMKTSVACGDVKG